LFQKAKLDKIQLHTNEFVIAEIVWTLESYYGLDKEDIKNKVLTIMNTQGLTVDNSDTIVKSILLYVEKNIDFIDAYNSYWMKNNGITKVATFDLKHFNRIGGIEMIKY